MSTPEDSDEAAADRAAGDDDGQRLSRIRIVVAYDGRPFSGWQSQPNRNAVQDHLEAAVRAAAGADRRIPVHGSGRTDAGVHALGQVAHFDAPGESRLAPEAWQRALNAMLPPTIRIMRAGRAPAGFHARFSAIGKTYHYRLVNAPVLSPFDVGLAWHVRGKLDLDRLADALGAFEGTHDFRAFAANRGDGSDAKDGGNPVRTLDEARLVPDPDGVAIRLSFHGDGFLYRMVRLLTGSAVRVAQRRSSLDWLHSLLAPEVALPGAPKSSFCAPSDGLFLMGVDYPADVAG